MVKKIPIGIDDFAELIEKDYYFVDKTFLIQEVIDSGAKATLITRPRRFGKTLNLSMLRYFFEKNELSKLSLFNGLKIMHAPQSTLARQGKYPVIFLTFKEAKQSEFSVCLDFLKSHLADEYKRHSYLLVSERILAADKELFEAVLKLTPTFEQLGNSLKLLTRLLATHYQEQVIVLLDEYDTPINFSYINGYYPEMIEFMRSFLGGGLKNNPHLELAVITGIYRVAKESIFSGINHLEVCTILSDFYQEQFGFTESEVRLALEEYQLSENLAEIKTWYNGYLIGKTEIYNPWSIINYLKTRQLQEHWINTSSNDLIMELLAHSSKEIKADLEELLKGNLIQAVIDENTVYGSIDTQADSIWSFLFFSGYLKMVAREPLETGVNLSSLCIPNQEVFKFYRAMVTHWFGVRIKNRKIDLLLKSLLTGNVEDFAYLFQELLLETVGIFDLAGRNENPEVFYHAFVLGLLVYLEETHLLKSNRESGYGRYDIMLIPKEPTDLGVIIEFKKVNHLAAETLESAVTKALRQIEEKQYETELRSLGVMQVLKLGMAFEGKKVLVRAG